MGVPSPSSSRTSSLLTSPIFVICDKRLCGLSIVLGEVDVQIFEAELTQDQRNNLADLVSSCQSVLEDLQGVLSKLSLMPGRYLGR